MHLKANGKEMSISVIFGMPEPFWLGWDARERHCRWKHVTLPVQSMGIALVLRLQPASAQTVRLRCAIPHGTGFTMLVVGGRRMEPRYGALQRVDEVTGELKGGGRSNHTSTKTDNCFLYGCRCNLDRILGRDL